MSNIILNYVDSEFEKSVEQLVPKKNRSGKYSLLYRNQVIRYGVNKPYDNNIVSPKIPALFNQFRNDIDFDSVTINEYLPDQIINWHVDLGKNDICIISLLSDAEMQFRNPESGEEINVQMPRYSFFRMTGEMRSEWQHSLKSSERRISVVFRKS